MSRIEKGTGNKATTLLTYDDMGNVLTETDALGSTTRYEYTDLDQIKRITHPNRTETVYNYDDKKKGRLVSVDFPGGGNVSYSYDGLGFVQTVTVAGAGTATYLRNDMGELTSMTSPRGAVTTFTYEDNDRGLLKSITESPSGRVTTYGRDAKSRIVSTTLSAPGFPDQVIGYALDDMDRVEKVTLPPIESFGTQWSPQDQVTTIRVAVAWEKVRREREPGASPLEEVAGYRYDERGRLVLSTLGESGTILQQRNAYDQANNLRVMQSPKIATAPDPSVHPKQFVDPDGFGRMSSTKNSQGDEVGKVVRDLADRVTEIWQPDSTGTLQCVEKRFYDSMNKNQLVRVEDLFGATTYEYYTEKPGEVEPHKGMLLKQTNASGDGDHVAL